MFIEINNLGPIREFRADLRKDLICIFGKNNIGKSYATSIIYLIIKNILKAKSHQKHIFDALRNGGMEGRRVVERVEAAINALRNNKDEVTITEELAYLAKYAVQHFFMENIQQSLWTTFNDLATLRGRRRQDAPRIACVTDSFKIVIKIFESDIVLEDVIFLKKIMIKIQKNNNQSFSIRCECPDCFVFTLDGQIDSNLSKDILISEFISKFYQELTQNIDGVYYFPASRSGLYQSLNAFSQIFAELSKNRRGFKSGRVDIPSIPEPVSDYFLGMSTIQTRNKAGNAPIAEIVKEMERQILKGDVKFNEADKKIYYAPHRTGLNLTLSMTSSMVSEITPIVSYLKYIIAYSPKANDSKSVFFIEEPEAHLHPEAQILLMEAFAKLIKENVKIIFTSHSNYMFNKINNLILNGDIPLDAAEAIVLENGPKGSFSKTSAKDEFGIEDENFIDAAEGLFNEKMLIIESMNKKT